MPETKHHRSSGVYAREMYLLKGYKAESHKHIFDHMSILSKGIAVVTVNNVSTTYVAPTVIEIKKDLIHSIMAIEDVTWFCIHNEENFKEEEIKIEKELSCHGE